MTNNDVVKNLAKVISERSEVISECIVAFAQAFNNHQSFNKVESVINVAESPKKLDTGEPKKTRKEREDAEVFPEEYTEDTLAEVSYNGLKKIAKKLGVSTTGDRETLTANILGASNSSVEDDKEEASSVDEEVDEEVEEEQPESDLGDPDMEDVEEETLADKVVKATEDMTNEDLVELLDSYQLPVKGKRQALIDRVIQAVEDGIIDFDADDGESEEEDEGAINDSADEEVEDAEVVNDSSEEDSEEADEEEEKQPAKKVVPLKKEKLSPRDKACKDYEDSVRAEVEDGDISRKDMIDYINKRMGTKSRMTKTSDEELLNKYIELQLTLIDDDGNLHEEEEPYELNGEYHCCGEPLKDNKDGTFKCSVCNAVYEG